MRRLLLVNALIFAVLAAAVALAYYGFSYTLLTSREHELQLLHDLAEEKVLNIEALVDEADTKLLREISVDDLTKLRDEMKTYPVVSVFVFDDQLRPVPDGTASTAHDAKAVVALRDWLAARVLPTLPLNRQPVDTRGHILVQYGGKPKLFSFTRKESGDQTYYVVIEDDIGHLVLFLFPQFFNFSPQSKRLYAVYDQHGGLVYGMPFTSDPDSLTVSVPFTDTVDNWVLRVAEKDTGVQAELHHRRVINSLTIGGAVAVILAGLAFLALAIRRERRSNELKSEFISNVSHELKTPLSIISLFGEMLANGRTKSPEQATEYAEIIWRESVRLGRLIDNVLDFAKIERGMGVYEFAEADLADVIDRALDLVGRRLTAADMTLDVELEPDLPPVRLDANAFTLAVLNLIDNATKYAADGKKLELRLRRDGERVVLAVRDFGPGIDLAEQDQIFERFYRARSVRLKPIRGSGIGLALVRHIARAHGGDVTVRSAPGEGATFELSLPLAA